MANSLAALRADIARSMGLLITGAVTGEAGGSTTQVYDHHGLAEYDEAGALRKCLLYISYDNGGAAAAPEGQSRFITSYSGVNKCMGLVEPFTAAPAEFDLYEVYRAYLPIAAWNTAVNQAILDAWPQVYACEIYDVASTGTDSYALPNTAEAVVAVYVQQTGARVGWPGYLVPPSAYQVTGTPGTDLFCRLLNSPGLAMRVIRFITKAHYAELATNAATTDLDHDYIVAAGMAYMYQQLQGVAGGQADISRYIQLMAHWQGVAAQRRAELAADLLGVPVAGGKAK